MQENFTYKAVKVTDIVEPRTNKPQKTLKLRRTGDQMPMVGLGTWKAEKGQLEQVVKTCVDELGYLHIDGAWIYGNENEIGDAITTMTNNGTLDRKNLFLVTKLWNNMHKPDDVIEACK